MFDQYETLMTIPEVCDALLIGRATAYQLLESGAVDGFKTGRSWKVKKDSLTEYVRKSAKLSTPTSNHLF